MSFTNTPLGQGRRLDHSAFLGKPQSPRLNSHTSYSYGAPALGSRSPPKPPHSDSQNEPALARFAKLKQQNSDSQSLDPEKWSVKDTSVNIATAFHQAATDMNPNSAWASGSSRTAATPRSTSVEYESQAQSTSARRLAAPPSRLQSRPTTSSSRAKPLSKSQSIRHVPDSEEEEATPEQNGRGKSPFEQVIGAAKRAIINAPAAATYYVRQRSREPDEPVAVNGSYDYSAEERDIQNQSKRGFANHKRNRMSTDNKAYKPSTSDLDSDEDFTDDDGKQKRRKKKKKESVGGPLTTLPVAGYDKRKKKPKKGSKGNAGEVEEGSDSDSRATDKQSAPRGSAPPPRQSFQPEQHDPNPDTSFEDAEQGLHSIPEVDDEDVVPIAKQGRSRSRSRSRGASTSARRKSFAPGAFIGIIIHAIFLVVGKVLGTSLDVILVRPIRAVARSPLAPFIKYAVLIGLLLLASRALPDIGLRVPWGGDKIFHPPEAPAGNMAEIAERLRRVETALSGLTLDSERTRGKVEDEARVNAELLGKISSLETRVERESVRVHEAEAASRDAAGQVLKSVKHDIEALQARVQAYQQQDGGGTVGSDEETRSRLKALEDRVGSVEGGVRDAIDQAKKGAGPASSIGAAWWSKPGKSGLTIKSSDGQDVTVVIADLVSKAVGMYGKDNIARADFALHSSGANVIPSLTSPTYELHPSTLRGKVVGYVTGNGFLIGRPPVTALHYDTHDGYCWPFAGSQGQLGVVLAAPVYIEDITIDHVAAEVAFNMMTSAPREMEVWAMVEGRDNLAKLKAWRAEKVERRQNGESLEDEPVRPKTLPKSTEYIRIASFRYDIHAPNNIQTFPVDQEIKDLGIDFGIVVLLVKSNWGMEAFTCLYRFRVHGQRMGAFATPYPEELSP